jgi:hypothetical protein
MYSAATYAVLAAAVSTITVQTALSMPMHGPVPDHKPEELLKLLRHETALSVIHLWWQQQP